MAWKFSGHLISGGVLINGGDGKSKNYVFTVNVKNEYKQAKTKYEAGGRLFGTQEYVVFYWDSEQTELE